MIILCSWCRETQGEKPPLEDRRITHTICPACFELQQAEIEQYFRLNPNATGETLPQREGVQGTAFERQVGARPDSLPMTLRGANPAGA
jgi:hypothetical protein